MLVFQYKLGTLAPQPNFSNVVLLLDLDNNTIDTSSYANAVSFAFHNSFATSPVKFGSHSGDFSAGEGDDYLQINGSNYPGGAYDFGTGDFSVEAWVYPTTIPGGGVFYDMNVFGKLTSTPPMFFFLRNSDLAPCLWNGTFQHTSSAGVPINQWSHVAWCRNSGTLRAFIDGVKVLDVAEPTDFGPAIGGVFSGGHGQITGRAFEGYIDEMRVVHGEGIYTQNFTPPTTVFPTS